MIMSASRSCPYVHEAMPLLAGPAAARGCTAEIGRSKSIGRQSETQVFATAIAGMLARPFPKANVGKGFRP
jgi:hypothetical protein